MALARLALKNLQQRASYSASLLARNVTAAAPPERQRWASQFLRGLSSAAEENVGSAHEVAVQEGGKKSKLSPRRRSRRGAGSLSRRDGRDFVPALWDIFPSGLGNALIQATENMNKLLETIAPPMGQVREHDDSYKLRYQMPGLGKDEVKITVEDGVLSIRGEHKDEKEEEGDDESWSSSSYGYYNTSLLLPEDAKVDEIKAEMKDGVLNIVIPKTERLNKDVKEVHVH
ncbi:HSP20-like chaperones superfamily protein [Perilla frutescens var. frutescens]|nr:HSP20-like chaperones superfamily protein [Perilla frutescens var. frutescens]